MKLESRCRGRRASSFFQRVTVATEPTTRTPERPLADKPSRAHPRRDAPADERTNAGRTRELHRDPRRTRRARRARLKAPASVTRSIIMSSSRDSPAKTPKSILSRQNSSANLGGSGSPTDMQIALLSQKVKDGSRGSVRVACAVRAVGGGNILQEPLAPYLAGGEEMRALLANRARREDARVVENVAVRHRAIDDVILRHCAPEDGIRQVVSVNGGLDTRAHRLVLPNVAWFDVDLFDVLELKKKMLEKAPEALKHYASPRVASVTNVGMDVLSDAPRYLKLELEKHGVDFTAPVLYVFEACLYNFSAADARELTRSLPRTRGSVLVGTHLQRGMLRWVRDPRHQADAPYLAELAHHWRSSLEDAAKAGAFRGWRVRNVKSLTSHAFGYGYRVPPNLWKKGEEVVFELHRGRCRASSRPAKKGLFRLLRFWRSRQPRGPLGPPATASRRDSRGLRTPDARTSMGGWIGVAVRVGALTLAGFVGHRHGGDVAKVAEKTLERCAATARLAKSRYVDPCAEFAMDKCAVGLGAARRGAARAREGVAHVRRTHVDPRLPERYRLPRKDASSGKGKRLKKGW